MVGIRFICCSPAQPNPSRACSRKDLKTETAWSPRNSSRVRNQPDANYSVVQPHPLANEPTVSKSPPDPVGPPVRQTLLVPPVRSTLLVHRSRSTLMVRPGRRTLMVRMALSQLKCNRMVFISSKTSPFPFLSKLLIFDQTLSFVRGAVRLVQVLGLAKR